MALAKFVCPHCEKPGEVQVTAVTRSRPCPHCGEQVMLQVAEKASKGKRKALLVSAEGHAPVVPDRPKEQSKLPEPKSPASPPRSSTSNTEPNTVAAPTADMGEAERPKAPSFQVSIPTSISGPAYEPQSLEGEAFERMRMDPEIQATRRIFLLGTGSTLALIIFASIAHFFWPEPPVAATPAPAKVIISAPNPSRLPPNTIGLLHGAAEPSSSEKQKPMEINFDTKSLDLGAKSAPQPLPPTEPVRMPALR
jgi:hypothetical protein